MFVDDMRGCGQPVEPSAVEGSVCTIFDQVNRYYRSYRSFLSWIGRSLLLSGESLHALLETVGKELATILQLNETIEPAKPQAIMA